MMWASFPSGAICHLEITWGEGLGKTTVTEFLWRPGGDAVLIEHGDCIFCGVQHSSDQAAETRFTVTGQREPQHERGQGAARPGQRCIVGPYELDSATDSLHVCLSSDHDATGKGCADELVTADGNAVDAGVECEGLRVVDKGKDHAAQRGVGVDVGARDHKILKDLPDFRYVVDRAAHRGADVGHSPPLREYPGEPGSCRGGPGNRSRRCPAASP